MMAVIPSAKHLRRSNALVMTAREKEHAKRHSEMQQKLKQNGLAGQRLGKHKVPEGKVDVQLGEELSESLRALKVNLSHPSICFNVVNWLPHSRRVTCSAIVSLACSNGR